MALALSVALLGACADDPQAATAPAEAPATESPSPSTAPTPPRERSDPAVTEEPMTEPAEPADGEAGVGAAEDADVATETVEMFYLAYRPSQLNVKVGDKVEWVNGDNADHTVTFESGEDSGQLARDDRFSRTFDEPGEHPYVCLFHPSMSGTVTVLG